MHNSCSCLCAKRLSFNSAPTQSYAIKEPGQLLNWSQVWVCLWSLRVFTQSPLCAQWGFPAQSLGSTQYAFPVFFCFFFSRFFFLFPLSSRVDTLRSPTSLRTQTFSLRMNDGDATTPYFSAHIIQKKCGWRIRGHLAGQTGHCSFYTQVMNNNSHCSLLLSVTGHSFPPNKRRKTVEASDERRRGFECEQRREKHVNDTITWNCTANSINRDI